jgi:hypothetical protein
VLALLLLRWLLGIAFGLLIFRGRGSRAVAGLPGQVAAAVAVLHASAAVLLWLWLSWCFVCKLCAADVLVCCSEAVVCLVLLCRVCCMNSEPPTARA